MSGAPGGHRSYKAPPASSPLRDRPPPRHTPVLSYAGSGFGRSPPSSPGLTSPTKLRTKRPVSFGPKSYKSPPSTRTPSPQRVVAQSSYDSSPFNDFDAVRSVDYAFGDDPPGAAPPPAALSPSQRRMLGLQQQKAEAVAREDFAEAQRLKELLLCERAEVTPSTTLKQSTAARRFVLDSNPAHPQSAVVRCEVRLTSLNGAGAVHLRDITRKTWDSFSCAGVLGVGIGASESRAFTPDVDDPGLCVSVRLRGASYDLEFEDPDWCLKFVNGVTALSPLAEALETQAITERQRVARQVWRDGGGGPPHPSRGASWGAPQGHAEHSPPVGLAGYPEGRNVSPARVAPGSPVAGPVAPGVGVGYAGRRSVQGPPQQMGAAHYGFAQHGHNANGWF